MYFYWVSNIKVYNMVLDLELWGIAQALDAWVALRLPSSYCQDLF